MSPRNALVTVLTFALALILCFPIFWTMFTGLTPRQHRDLALLAGRFHLHAHRALELRPARIARLLGELDAWRRPERFEQFLLACEADARGRAGRAEAAYPQAAYLRRALALAGSVQPLTGR